MWSLLMKMFISRLVLVSASIWNYLNLIIDFFEFVGFFRNGRKVRIIVRGEFDHKESFARHFDLNTVLHTCIRTHTFDTYGKSGYFFAFQRSKIGYLVVFPLAGT